MKLLRSQDVVHSHLTPSSVWNEMKATLMAFCVARAVRIRILIVLLSFLKGLGPHTYPCKSQPANFKSQLAYTKGSRQLAGQKSYDNRAGTLASGI